MQTELLRIRNLGIVALVGATSAFALTACGSSSTTTTTGTSSSSSGTTVSSSSSSSSSSSGTGGEGGSTASASSSSSSGVGGSTASASSSSSSTSTSTSSSSSSSSASSSSSSSSSSGGATVNGCTAANATDMTGMGAVTITFQDFSYSPKCLKVTAGTSVTFSGSFTAHPLAGGDAPPTVDANSPIKNTTSGSTATFEIPNAGSYGYFCQFHYASEGMEGAIFAQ